MAGSLYVLPPCKRHLIRVVSVHCQAAIVQRCNNTGPTLCFHRVQCQLMRANGLVVYGRVKPRGFERKPCPFDDQGLLQGYIVEVDRVSIHSTTRIWRRLPEYNLALKLRMLEKVNLKDVTLVFNVCEKSRSSTGTGRHRLASNSKSDYWLVN
jgi:hypothetical protein